VSNNEYEQLADALNRLPNGFPRTQSGVELEILKKIFSPQEALIAHNLGVQREPYDVIAEKVGISAERLKSILMTMAQRGLVWLKVQKGKPWVRLAPWIGGIYEAQLEIMDHQFAHLIEEYFHEAGAEGIMRPQPAIHRVIPAQEAVKSEWILPYDDVRAILEASKVFGVRKCICRVQQEYIGRKCDFPLDICITFSSRERDTRPGDISKDTALALLDKAEEIGLVHTVSNVMEGFYYVCNCCGCCCGIMRGITDFGIEHSVAHSNYYAVVDVDSCVGCGVCQDRCHVKAISLKEGVATVNRQLCIGCGLCVTGCQSSAAHLHLKPEDEIVHPPLNFKIWELQRLRNRGITPS
jgi:NAD-dependent dihydropyrimidine dehydrogenase PreA subunit